jgi:hypothetical protein
MSQWGYYALLVQNTSRNAPLSLDFTFDLENYAAFDRDPTSNVVVNVAIKAGWISFISGVLFLYIMIENVTPKNKVRNQIIIIKP